MQAELIERRKELKSLLKLIEQKLVLEELTESRYIELKQRYQEELAEIEAELSRAKAESQLKTLLLLSGISLLILGTGIWFYSYLLLSGMEIEMGIETSKEYVFLKTANIVSIFVAIGGAVLSLLEIVKYEIKRYEYTRKLVFEKEPEEVRELIIRSFQRLGAKVTQTQELIKCRYGSPLSRNSVKFALALSGTKDRTEVYITYLIRTPESYERAKELVERVKNSV
jgi:hypothetical protein